MSSCAKVALSIVVVSVSALMLALSMANADPETPGTDLTICQNWNSPPQAALAACSSLLGMDGLTPLGRSNVLTRRGHAFQKLGELDWATADFDAALAIQSDNRIALIDRAELHRKAGHPKEAIADFSRVIELDPRPYLFLERGHAYEDSGAFSQAIEDFGTAAQLDPRYPFGLHDRGRIYLRQGNLVAAIADFDAAIKLDPSIKEIFLDRAIAHQQNNDFKQAETDFDSALALDSHWILALEDRGILFASIGEFDKGIADYNTAIRSESPSARTFTLRGIALSEKGETSRALADFDQALSIDPKYDEASRQKLLAYARDADQRDPDRDLHECDQLLTFQPHNADLLLACATILLKKGRREEALKSIDAVLKIQPGDPKALEQRALIEAKP